MYHYQHDVMGGRAACGNMAAMYGRSTPLTGNADETSSLYIYIYISMLWTHSGLHLPNRPRLPLPYIWSTAVKLHQGLHCQPGNSNA